MKLSDYAKMHGICYKTAWRHVRDGLITVSRTPTGRFEINAPTRALNGVSDKKVAIYCRVSSAENKDNLHAQRKRLEEWCALSGYAVVKVVEEIGSGVNDKRRRWLNLLADVGIDLIVVEHKDRFTRFGFTAYQQLLRNSGREIVVVNDDALLQADLVQDFIDIITSFCARIYGLRRTHRKTEKLIAELTGQP